MIAFPWFRRAPSSPLALAYRQGTAPRVGRKTELDALTFVVLDAETSGFDPTKDRILSLAAVPVKAGKLEMALLHSWLLYHSGTSLTEAVSVHGILPSDTKGGEPEQAVLEQLLPLITGAVLVGHHVAFDVGMLNAALQRHFHVRLRNPVLDTAQLAMRVLEPFRKTGYPGQRAPSLDEVCTHCGITPLERHTAAGDTFTTAELLMVLCARFARQLNRPLTPADLPLARA
ncbi:MAG TPA: 3'-5' exonuclease [Opitutaceae bacterium]|nr:3'-5' exonuclease [Opitutaceae bacterium]